MQTFKTGFLIFPHLTQLDFTGPLQVLARLPQSKVHILGKSKDPVSSDCGLDLLPTCTFESCPDLDLICVPGGAEGAMPKRTDRWRRRSRVEQGDQAALVLKFVAILLEHLKLRSCTRFQWLASILAGMSEVVALPRMSDAGSDRARLDFYIRLPNRPTLRLRLVTHTKNGACFASGDTLPRYFVGRVSGERVERMYELVWQQNGLAGAGLVTARTMRHRRKAASRQAVSSAVAMP